MQVNMKLRNILYGYMLENGIIKIQSDESDVVKKIYKSYLDGKSLLDISKILNERQIEYMPGVIGWNKARLKRIIDNEKYTGKGSMYLNDQRYEIFHFERFHNLFSIEIVWIGWLNSSAWMGMDESHELNAFLIPFLDDRIKFIAVRFISCSGHICRFVKIKVVDVFSVGAAEDASRFWNPRSDGLANLREHFFGNKVGFRFFFRCHFSLPP